MRPIEITLVHVVMWDASMHVTIINKPFSRVTCDLYYLDSSKIVRFQTLYLDTAHMGRGYVSYVPRLTGLYNSMCNQANSIDMRKSSVQ